jgi:hypothetical protein
MAHTKQNSPRPLLLEEAPLARSRRMNMNKRKHGISFALLMLALPLLAVAQDDTPASAGSIWGRYSVQQSVEFGGRIADVNGNQQLYDTLVNLRSGPRLLGQELTMRPMTPGGEGLFDSLYLSSFGFGGDPNDMARLRIEKSKWYNFVGLYRRDENYFNFNLFANPLNLNPGIGATLNVPANPAFPASSPIPWSFDPRTMPWYVNSPHLQDTTRNMGDFNLTLFPQSAVRIRLGYARNVNAGRLDTTLESPRTMITEYSQSRSDRYQFGVDFKVMKRTTLSFDQFFEHDKVDPNFRDNNLSFVAGAGNLAGTPPGTLIDIGVLFPPSGCAAPPPGTFTLSNTGANVYTSQTGCNINGLYGFNRSGNVRTDIHTSQLSLQSNYFRKLDVTASGTYSFGHSDFPNFQEFSNTVLGPSLDTATSHTDRVSGNADLGLTYHLSRSLSFSDKFRWLDWRNPGSTNQISNICTGIAAPGLTVSGAGCSPDPLSATSISTLIAERTYNNTAKLNWASTHISAYVGYRYGRRELTGAHNTEGNGDTPVLNSYFSTDRLPFDPKRVTKINEHTALVGVVLRPTNQWRINADLELLNADNAFTNIGPRHQQRVRINATYKVNHWASVTGGVHFVETRNDFAESANASPLANPANPNLFPNTTSTVRPAYGHKDHWRYYTFGTSLNPNRMVGFDFGWTYLDQLINSDTCVPVAANAISPAALPSTGLCNGFRQGGIPLILDYQERTITGYAHVTIRPVHRVALNVGYDLTSTSGFNRWMLPGGTDGTGVLLVKSDAYGNSPPLSTNPTSPPFPGPFPDAPLSQALNWHKPTVGIAIDVAKNVTFKGNYAYFDYNEKETQGLPLVALPRNFHANTGTLSLKYAF